MTITIDCSCGTSFEVELDPAAGPVSAPVGCPQCGTDAAESLNAALAASAPPGPAAATADATETPALPAHCAQHPDQPVEMFCFVCKKPMCATCMENHGFVCSPYCRQQARDQGLVIPTYEREQTTVRRRQRVRGRLIGSGITVLVVVLIIAWVWWRQVGRKPRPVFTLELGGADYGARAQFLGAEQVLYRGDQRLALYDARDGTKLWSTEAPQYHQARLLRVTDTDLWLSVARSIVRLDRGTGEQAASWPLDRPALRYDVSDRGLLVVMAGTTNTQRQLTWLRLADGKILSQATTILVPPPAPP
ncbi:hypothetical protein HQ590_07600, partial [bacterium]|nr:hypothetical protein [bacterium]